MSWFQLDPRSLADRAAGMPTPTATGALLRGMIGFTLVSVAGFAPWGLFGKWFHAPGHGGELGMYGTCAVVFLALCGVVLHKLILGKGSLLRFYLLFGVCFTAYSICWTVGWMALRGDAGSVVGLLAGTSVMGVLMVAAFDAWEQTAKVIVALFLLNALGYFAGGWFEGPLLHAPKVVVFGMTLSRSAQVAFAMMQWAVCYGLGFGAGIGLAFHFCQTKARALLFS